MATPSSRQACVPTSLPPTTYMRELPPLALRRPDCTPRNVYIDMGANWCNSLRLFRRVPHAASSSPHEGSGWQVYAFEMAPLIMPYVEACCEALSRGQPLPPAPVPPSGSSSHLLRYAEMVGCHLASRGLQLQCMERTLNASLAALRINRRLLGNDELIRARLGAARRNGCEPGSPFTYTLVPSAVGVREGASVRVGTGTRGLSQLLRGGMSLVSSGRPSTSLLSPAHDAPNTTRPHVHDAPLATVPMIDVLYWLRSAFEVADHVVRGMGVPNTRSEARAQGLPFASLSSPDLERLSDRCLSVASRNRRCSRWISRELRLSLSLRYSPPTRRDSSMFCCGNATSPLRMARRACRAAAVAVDWRSSCSRRVCRAFIEIRTRLQVGTTSHRSNLSIEGVRRGASTQ